MFFLITQKIRLEEQNQHCNEAENDFSVCVHSLDSFPCRETIRYFSGCWISEFPLQNTYCYYLLDV
jgi:tetrahydromethanopterin S-methyltransferase subunit B